MRFLTKISILAALGGLTALATGGAASAQCANCFYQTYYRPVVVRHCTHVVPHTVLRSVTTTHLVPVVSYQAVQHTQYVPETYYTRYTTSEPVYGGYEGYAGYRGGYGGGYAGYRDSSYGLEPDE